MISDCNIELIKLCGAVQVCYCVEENCAVAAASNGVQCTRRVSHSRVAPEEENQPGSAKFDLPAAADPRRARNGT